MLWLYRDALRIRHATAELHQAPFAWLDTAEEVIAFTRGQHLTCVVNFGTEAVDLPEGGVLVSSVALEGGQLPRDAAAWIQTNA